MCGSYGLPARDTRAAVVRQWRVYDERQRFLPVRGAPVPDIDGSLNSREYDQVREWLKEHWKDSWVCPMSGHTQWALASHIYQLTQFTPGELRIGGPVVPLVALTCDGCGYTVLLNAKQIGLTVETQPEPQEPQEVKEAQNGS